MSWRFSAYNDLFGYIHRGFSQASVESHKWQHFCVAWKASASSLKAYKDGAMVETYDDATGSLL